MNIFKKWANKIKPFKGELLVGETAHGKIPEKQPIDPYNPVPLPKPIKPPTEEK